MHGLGSKSLAAPSGIKRIRNRVDRFTSQNAPAASDSFNVTATRITVCFQFNFSLLKGNVMYHTLFRMPQRLLLAATLAGLGTIALAQGAAPAAAVASGPAAQHRYARLEQWHEHMAQRRAKHVADLKAALAITPEQESAWSQFEAAMKLPAMQRPAGQRGEWAKLTTPERIDRMEQRMADRQQRIKQMDEAVKTFYAQLTPQQQKVFDQRAMRMEEERAKERFDWHGKRGEVPHVRHHLWAKPEAAGSQAN
jgi:hypothetical protein